MSFNLKQGECLGAIQCSWHGTLYFGFDRDKSVTDLEKAARAAVAEHLKKHPPEEGDVSSWGEVFDEVDKEVWARHGLRLLESVVPDMVFEVGYDEELRK
jgi:hypothetical protein